jgi:methanogenic corrinoid protein MtbC1
MLADRMALAGWTVHFLGASVPEGEIAAAARALEADLVVLTVATHFNLLGLRSTVKHLERAVPNVKVMVGGPAFGAEHDWPPENLLAEHELGIDNDAGEEV